MEPKFKVGDYVRVKFACNKNLIGKSGVIIGVVPYVVSYNDCPLYYIDFINQPDFEDYWLSEYKIRKISCLFDIIWE